MKIRVSLIRVGLLIAIIFMFGINFAETTHSPGPPFQAQDTAKKTIHNVHSAKDSGTSDAQT